MSGDELRSQLPALAGRMSFGITQALAVIRKALDLPTPDCVPPEYAAGYRQSLEHALLSLRTAGEANDQFAAWCEEVKRRDVDDSGLTREERQMLIAPLRSE